MSTFFLFKPTNLNKKFTAQMKLMGNYELSKKKLYENYKFKSYKEFIDYCLNNG